MLLSHIYASGRKFVGLNRINEIKFIKHCQRYGDSETLTLGPASSTFSIGELA